MSRMSYKADKLVYQFTCPYVFGDDVEHTIVSYWKRSESGQMSCYRVELDGKEFSVTNEDPLILRSVAWIVLD